MNMLCSIRRISPLSAMDLRRDALLIPTVISTVIAAAMLFTSVPTVAADTLPAAAICRFGTTDDSNWSHGIYAVAFSPDGQIAATRSSDQIIRIWNLRDGALIRALPAYEEGRIKDMVFSQDSQHLIAAIDSDKSVPNIWSVADGQPFRADKLPATYLVRTTNTPGVVSFVSKHATIRRSIANPDQAIDAKGLPNAGGRAEPMAASPSGEQVLLRTTPAGMLLIVPFDGTPPGVLDGFQKPITHARWSPDGRVIAITCRDDRRVYFRDPLRTTIKINRGGHQAAIQDVAFSADSRLAVTAAVDGKIRLWETMTKQFIAEASEGPQRRLVSINFSSDGRYMATGSAGKDDNSAIVWDWKKFLLNNIRSDKTKTDAWEGLAEQDPQIAYPCIEEMVRDPVTTAFLTEKLGGLDNTLSRAEIDALIGQLNSTSYSVRNSAHEALARVRVTAAKRLREVLQAGTAPVETEVRLRKLLSVVSTTGEFDKSETRQLLRAVFVLELIDSAASRSLLKSVATTHPLDVIRTEARQSLKRLEPSPKH